MTGIAIARPSSGGVRMFAATLLVIVGLVVGVAFAQIAASARTGTAPAPQAQTLDEGYRAQRAGERGGSLSLSRNWGYHLQRLDEQAAGKAPAVIETQTFDDGYLAQRAGERGGALSLSTDAGYEEQRAGERSAGEAPVTKHFKGLGAE